MNPTGLLKLLFQYNLLHLYTPIINTVGFSTPLTFIIITANNSISLICLLLTVTVAFPVLHKKAWLLSVAVATVWIMIGINIITTLNITLTTSIAAVLPHGWLEFTAIAYWINALRKTTQSHNLPKPINIPTFKDYLKALTKPKRLNTLVKTDLQVTFRTTKLSFKTLCKHLKKKFVITLILIAAAALIETYLTPKIMLLSMILR